MIAKYGGVCSYCHLPTKAGVDQYDVRAKVSYHPECAAEASYNFDTSDDGDEPEKLAEKLGFE